VCSLFVSPPREGALLDHDHFIFPKWIRGKDRNRKDFIDLN